jgi:Formate/nitrite transporter
MERAGRIEAGVERLPRRDDGWCNVMAGGEGMPYGVSRLLGGVAFSLGLVLVVIAGAELFTGNNLIVMAWASRRVTTAAFSRNLSSSTRGISSARSALPC